MKKQLFFLLHLLAACSGSDNRDGLDSRIPKEKDTDTFIMITAGDLAYINRNGLVLPNNGCYVSFI
jgi:hypothetical protein